MDSCIYSAFLITIKKIFINKPHSSLSLRILAGKIHYQIKLKCLQKVWICIGSYTQIKFSKKQNSQCQKCILCDRVICSSHSICLNIGFWQGSFAWKCCAFIRRAKKWYPSFFKKSFSFSYNLFLIQGIENKPIS